MINTGVLGQPEEPAMSVLLKSLQEIGDEFPALKTRELQEVPPQEHPGMESNK